MQIIKSEKLETLKDEIDFIIETVCEGIRYIKCIRSRAKKHDWGAAEYFLDLADDKVIDLIMTGNQGPPPYWKEFYKLIFLAISEKKIPPEHFDIIRSELVKFAFTTIHSVLQSPEIMNDTPIIPSKFDKLKNEFIRILNHTIEGWLSIGNAWQYANDYHWDYAEDALKSYKAVIDTLATISGHPPSNTWIHHYDCVRDALSKQTTWGQTHMHTLRGVLVPLARTACIQTLKNLNIF
ncbi:MAG: hypothetical protein ACE5R6_02990 [Candidatus Heimdallarchaeota archaeon]